MRARAAGLTGTIIALCLVSAACGGAEEEVAAPGSPSPAASASPSGDPTDGEASESPTASAEAYLPTPDGVLLTRPGTQLKLRRTATAAWEPRQDLVGVVDVAVTRIAATTIQAALAGFDLSAEEQRATPYFVSSEVTNVGDTDLGARQLPLYFLDQRGVLVAPTGVARDFEACPGSTLPAVFAPGDAAESCLIFLAPEGSQLQSIMFRPPEGVVPLQWRGRVTEPGHRDGSKSSRRKAAGDKDR